MAKLTHLDAEGNAIMVNVGEKPVSRRLARAAGTIALCPEAYQALRRGDTPKGDVLAVARVAGIMAAKNTSSLIPLCHGLMLTSVKIDFAWQEEGCRLEALCTAECTGQTGVEMEALTGATAALLTVYDMCKALDKTMVIGDIRLLQKQGGKSGGYQREEPHA